MKNVKKPSSADPSQRWVGRLGYMEQIRGDYLKEYRFTYPVFSFHESKAQETQITVGTRRRFLSENKSWNLGRELEKLSYKARRDNYEGENARQEYTDLVIGAVKNLEAMASSQSDLWKHISRQKSSWPVMLSNQTMHQHRAKELITLLDVGGARSDSKTRWNSDSDPFTELALALHNHIHECRIEARKLTGEISYPKITIFYSRQWQEKAVKLAPFNRNTHAQWYAVAEEVLLESYPRPELVNEFHELRKMAIDRLKKQGKGKTEIGIRGRILYELEERFESLSGARRKDTN